MSYLNEQPLVVMPEKPFQVFEKVFQSKHIHYYLNTDIQEPHLYSDIVNHLTTAEACDTFYFHLNTAGGRLDTGIQLINAMRTSLAKVVTVLDGKAYSLGTLLLLSGQEIVVHDFGTIMIHNFSSGMYGKGHELTSQLEATTKSFNHMAKQIYVPFISETEFNRVIKGEDLWMDAIEIRERLERVNQAANPHIKERKRKTKDNLVD